MVHVRRLLNIVDIFGQYFFERCRFEPYFFVIFCPFSKNEIYVAKNGQKVKAATLLLCHFLPLTFWSFFCHFFKNGISGQKWTKSKGYSLTFLSFFASFQKWNKWPKMDEK